MRSVLWLALALVLGAPASAHLLVRGTPLSELAVSSAVAVVGRVESGGARAVTLAVEEVVLGKVEPGKLSFAAEGQHPPDYAAGSRVLVFLKGSAAPWVSRQTALDLVEVPAGGAEREALLAAVRAYAGLRALPDRAGRIAGLAALALGNLESPSERVRADALLDLVAIAPRTSFDAAAVARVAGLARRAGPRAPGLVVLLAAMRVPEAETALVALARSAASPQSRARALRVVGRRQGEKAVPALREGLRDPALEVRLTAQRELERIGSPAARGALRAGSTDSTGRES